MDVDVCSLKYGCDNALRIIIAYRIVYRRIANNHFPKNKCRRTTYISKIQGNLPESEKALVQYISE